MLPLLATLPRMLLGLAMCVCVCVCLTLLLDGSFNNGCDCGCDFGFVPLPILYHPPNLKYQDITAIICQVAAKHKVRPMVFPSFLAALRHHFRHITDVNDSPVYGEKGKAFVQNDKLVAITLTELEPQCAEEKGDR